jgi:hypothetical protein
MSPKKAQRWQIMLGLAQKRLLDIATHFGVRGLSGSTFDDMTVWLESEASFGLLHRIIKDKLMNACIHAGLDDSPARKEALIERLLGGKSEPRPAPVKGKRAGTQPLSPPWFVDEVRFYQKVAV